MKKSNKSNTVDSHINHSWEGKKFMKRLSQFIISGILLTSGLSFAYYGDGPSAVRPVARHSHFRESLTLAKKHWELKRPNKYDFKLELRCFCQDTTPKRIFVENKVVVKVIDVNTNSEVDRNQFSDFSVNGIFKQIENYLKQSPYQIGGAFDAINGVPVYFYVDVRKEIADEEMGFVLNDFEITQYNSQFKPISFIKDLKQPPN